MDENTLIKHFFQNGTEVDPTQQFNLSRKARARRLGEILALMRKHHVTEGLTP